MKIPDIQTEQHEAYFDKDAQGAHESHTIIEQNGNEFTVKQKNYDAYLDEWTESIKTGKIVAYFPSKQLVRLEYSRGGFGFFNLTTRFFTNYKDDWITHFYNQSFDPTQIDEINQLAHLINKILSHLEQKEITLHFEKNQFPIHKTLKRFILYSNKVGDFQIFCRYNPKNVPIILDMALLNPSTSYHIALGLNQYKESNSHNFFIRGTCLKKQENNLIAIVKEFSETHTQFTLEDTK